jgi:iron complex transport system ATP-binding protein
MKKKNTKPMIIEMENVTVCKNGNILLDNFSLNIKNGENVAIIGPNGAGKSSFIKTVTGNLRPLQSEKTIVRLFGKKRWDIFGLRNKMGIISGDLQDEYMRNIPGIEVVVSGFFSSIGLYRNHTITGDMKRRAHEVLGFLGIEHLASRPINEMSTGQARRLLVARALVHDPDVLILDEPANSLDIRARHIFRQSMRTIASKGKNIILVTHNLEDLIPEIDRVVLLSEGRVYRDGPADEILTAENLSDIFGIQVQVFSKDGYYHAW